MKDIILKFFRDNKLAHILLICVLGSVIYSNTFSSSFHLDDTHSIVENARIRQLHDLKSIWEFWPSRFLTYLSIAVNYHFHGLGVFGYHLVNIILHLVTACLVWWVVSLILSTVLVKAEVSKAPVSDGLIALCAALVFVSHPIQTEAITYIIQRATILASLFYLATLGFYIKARILEYENVNLRLSKLYFVVSVVIAVLAMFTKEIALTLPFAIWLCDKCLFSDKKDSFFNRKMFFLPFVIGVGILMTSCFSASSRQVTELSSDLGAGRYLLTQIRVLVTYLRLLVLPINQNVDYDYYISKTLFEAPVLFSFLFLACLITVAFLFFKRYKLLSFAVFWFFLTLLPESSVIPIRDVIFEHRLYLPIAGYSLFLACLLRYFFKKKYSPSIVIVFCGVLGFYSVLTYSRNFVWESEISLWTDAVEKSSVKVRPLINRGIAYASLGLFDYALGDFNKAVIIDPEFHDAYINRGNLYYKRQEFDLALSDFNEAIRLQPGFAVAYFDRGCVYQKKGDFDNSIADYNMALALDPGYVKAYYNRALVYFSKKEFDLSRKDLSALRRLNASVPIKFLDAFNRVD